MLSIEFDLVQDSDMMQIQKSAFHAVGTQQQKSAFHIF